MDILSFHKISRPIIEAGATIDMRPRAMWQPRILRTDGTWRYPWGDQWHGNHILNQFVDGFLSNPTTTKGAFFSTINGTAQATSSLSFASLFSESLDTAASYWFLRMRVGTGTAPATQSDTSITNPKTSDAIGIGNTGTISASNGNLVYTITRRFAAATGTEVWTEGGLMRIGPNTFNEGNRGWLGATYNAGSTFNEDRLQSRILFPQAVTVNTGEVLELVCAVTVPTLAVNAQTVTFATQNGMNISGQLKLVGTSASIIGGTIDNTAGTLTANTQLPLISDWTASRAGLSALTSHAAFNTASSSLAGNDVQGVWAAYTTGSRFRDMTFTWPVGTPATNTNLRSITIYRNGSNTTSGYQLLLDNQQTKASNAAMSVTFRWQL